MKFSEWKNTYFEVYLKPRIKRHTIQIYDALYNRYIKEYFDNCELNDITCNQINHFMYDLIKIEKKDKGKLKASTINLVLTLLKSIIKEAYLQDLLDKDPTRRVKKLPEDEKKTEVLRTKDQKKLVAYCMEHKDDSRYLGLILTLYTGLRIGELLALTWDKVNLRSRVIEIDKTIVIVKEEEKRIYDFTKPKSNSSIRTIPIPHSLFSILQEEKNKSLSKFVVNYKGEMCKIRSYQYFFEMVLRRCDIPKIKFHALRHTFATRCVELGIDIKTVAEILGHKNATITLNRYSHSLTETKRKALNKLCNNIVIE